MHQILSKHERTFYPRTSKIARKLLTKGVEFTQQFVTMKLAQKNRINQSISRISSDTFSLDDVELFINRIKNITKGDKLLWDFVNFIGHWEGRREGKSYENIKPYISSVIAVLENDGGGTIGGLPTIFTEKDLIERLINNLRANGIYVNEGRFKKNSDKIFQYLVEIIKDVEFKISGGKVFKCFLKQDEKNEKRLLVCFQLKNVKSSWVSDPNSGTFCTNFFN